MLGLRVQRSWYVILGLAVALCGALVARAEEAPRWRALTDQVFHPVGRDIDMPSVLIPDVIVQDAAGFIWIGQETGLLRWDGYRFRSYAYDHTHPDSLQDDFVQSLHRDQRGKLWIGSVSGGLARYDDAADRVIAVPLDGPAGASLRIWAMQDDGAGGLWVASSSGLFRLDPQARVVVHLRHQDGQPGSLPNDVVSALLRDRQGTLWIGTNAGLARGIANNTAFAPVALPSAGGGASRVQHLFEDSAGRIWVGTRQNGAYVVEPGASAAESVAATSASGADGAAPEINAIAEVAPGRIWLGTYGRGILEIDADTRQARRMRHDPLVPSSLDNDTVRAIFRDHSGIVWVGTNLGLSQYMPDNGILTVLGAAGRTTGLTDGDVGAVLVRPDGGLWIGTEGGSINIFNSLGERTAVLAVGRVFCLANAPSGGVLVGTNNGLFLADAAGRRLTRLVIPQRGLSTGVFALHITDSTVWLGGLDDGVWVLHIDAAGRVTVQRHVTDGGLATANVRAIESLPDGRLAIGTDDGFDLLDRTTFHIDHISPDPADPSGLAAHHVMSFVTGRDGRLWVGTDSAGISVLEGRDAGGRWRFRHLTAADGLPNEDIDMMLADRAGRIWASTDSGIAVIDPDSFSVHALRRADGVAITAYWSGSGTSTPDGDLLFGGLGGLTVVQPDRVSLWRYEPDVAVTSVRIGGKDVPIPPADAPADALGPVLRITPSANGLAVEFASLDLSAPALNRYGYRLEGYDGDWIETDAAHRVATYANLPPGDYTLSLRGSNRAGIWSDRQQHMHIRVLPAWFQSLWFRLSAAAFAAATLVCLVQGRTLLLRRRQSELERQVADRTAELIASQKQLHHFAFFDVLTALPNRRAFNDRLRTMISDSRRSGSSFALLLVDLDGFKQVNDSLGHDAGDEVLVVAAGRMRECLGACPFAARLGGDEFAILLEEAGDLVAVDRLCEDLVARMAQPATIGHGIVTTGASMGVALFPQHSEDAEGLLRHVDLALYEAKRAGRGTWRWYRETQPAALVFAQKAAGVLKPRRLSGSR